MPRTGPGLGGSASNVEQQQSTAAESWAAGRWRSGQDMPWQAGSKLVRQSGRVRRASWQFGANALGFLVRMGPAGLSTALGRGGWGSTFLAALLGGRAAKGGVEEGIVQCGRRSSLADARRRGRPSMLDLTSQPLGSVGPGLFRAGWTKMPHGGGGEEATAGMCSHMSASGREGGGDDAWARATEARADPGCGKGRGGASPVPG